MSPDPVMGKALMGMVPPKAKREMQSFMGTVNYQSKFSPVATDDANCFGS